MKATISLCLAAIASTGVATAAVASPLLNFYPKDSLQAGEEGIVEWAVDLAPDASIETCVVTRSSGYARLDEATCDMIVASARFAPAEAAGTRVATTRTGRVNWRLPSEYRQNAARAPRAQMFSKAQLEKNRLYCKRATTTGSMLRTTAYCLTKEEWDLARDNARKQMDVWIGPRRG